MPTSTAQMPNKQIYRNNNQAAISSSVKHAFSFLEMIIVLVIVSLLTGIVAFNFGGKISGNSFKQEAMQIVSTLKMAQNGASQTGRRYAVLFDIIEQTYTLKEIRTKEDLISENIQEYDIETNKLTTQLSDRCRIEFITFDDMTDTRDRGAIEDQIELKSYFVAGKSGWQNGGKIGLTDKNGNPYSIIVNRISKSIIIEEGDIDTYFLEPRKNLVF